MPNQTHKPAPPEENITVFHIREGQKTRLKVTLILAVIYFVVMSVNALVQLFS